jgi:hypothetical protein
MRYSTAPKGALNKFRCIIDQQTFQATSVGYAKHPWKNPTHNNKDFSSTLPKASVYPQTLQSLPKTLADCQKSYTLSFLPVIFHLRTWQAADHYGVMYTV